MLSTALNIIIEFNDLFSSVKPLKLFPELDKLSFEGFNESVESVLNSFLVPAKLLFFDSLTFVDFKDELFIVHDFTCFWMISFALRTTKTVLN